MEQKIRIDTGGVPVVYFDKVIGLFNLSKMTEVPNFAVDLKNIQQSVSSGILPVDVSPVSPSREEEVAQPVQKESEDEALITPKPQSPPVVKMEVDPEEKVQKNRNVAIKLIGNTDALKK